MNTGLLIQPDLTAELYEFDGYRDIQRAVGGNFDVAVGSLWFEGGPTPLDLWVHDEGLLIGLPINPVASALGEQVLVGPCLVTGRPNFEGDSTSINPRLARLIIRFCEGKTPSNDHPKGNTQ